MRCESYRVYSIEVLFSYDVKISAPKEEEQHDIGLICSGGQRRYSEIDGDFCRCKSDGPPSVQPSFLNNM